MVNLTNEEHQRLCELAQRAEADEVRVKELEHDLEVDDWHGAFVHESERSAQMEQNWTNCVIKLAGVTHESDEWKELYLLRGKAIDDLIAERDTAWTELRVIRKTIGADDNEATSDEVSRMFGKLTAERDELQHEIMRLPKPPEAMGDGPQERVSFSLEQIAYCNDLRSSITNNVSA